LVDDVQEISKVRLDLYVAGTPCRFSAEVEIGTYRIVQEALNNAVKHSDAQSVEIDTRFADGMLHIAVRDDGSGFPVDEAPRDGGKHAGLIGMTERARSLGGRLFVASVLGQGTTVTAEIPCQPQSRSAGRPGPRRSDSHSVLMPEPILAGKDGVAQ
ncbi:sensor histidine kinase, partial [Chloroflexota bacterium]